MSIKIITILLLLYIIPFIVMRQLVKKDCVECEIKPDTKDLLMTITPVLNLIFTLILIGMVIHDNYRIVKNKLKHTDTFIDKILGIVFGVK